MSASTTPRLMAHSMPIQRGGKRLIDCKNDSYQDGAAKRPARLIIFQFEQAQTRCFGREHAPQPLHRR